MNKQFLKLFLLLIITGITACSKKDDTPAPKYEDFVDSKMETILTNMGVANNKGINPPVVMGEYVINPFKCTRSNFSDGLEGMVFGTAALSLTNQNMERKSVDFNNYTTYSATMTALQGTKDETWKGNGCFISGEGNKFSIFFHSDGVLNKNNVKSSYKNLVVLSGEIDKDATSGKIKGIKNLQMASIMADDYGDPNNTLIEIGQGRLFTNTYAAVKQ